MSHYPNPLFEQLYVVPESSYGALTEPVSTNAIRHVRASFNHTQERSEREDKHGSRGVMERVSRRKALKYEIESYVLPSGQPGSVPEVSELLEAHGLKKRATEAATVASSPAPTVNSCALSSSSAVASEEAVGFVIEGEYYLRYVTDNAGGVISWTPDLPSPPAVDSTIIQTVSYSPASDPTNSVSIWRFLDGVAFAYPGCVGDGWELSISGGGEARFRFRGLGGEERMGGSDVLTQDVNDTATSFSVEDAGRFEEGLVLQIEGETVRVVSADPGTNVIEVERGHGGGSTSAHLTGAELAPYQPTASVSGTPVAGILGRVEMAGGVFEITEATCEFREGLRMREGFGKERPTGFSYPERRRVVLSLGGFLTMGTAGDYGRTKRFEAVSVDIQAGVSPGLSVALHIPRFEADIPEITAESGQEVALKLSGPCLETAGDDEVSLIFG